MPLWPETYFVDTDDVSLQASSCLCLPWLRLKARDIFSSNTLYKILFIGWIILSFIIWDVARVLFTINWNIVKLWKEGQVWLIMFSICTVLVLKICRQILHQIYVLRLLLRVKFSFIFSISKILENINLAVINY